MIHDKNQITIRDHEGNLIERTDNVEYAVADLYGDLNYHDGHARTVIAPPKWVGPLTYEAEIQADCFGIPIDIVKARTIANMKEW